MSGLQAATWFWPARGLPKLRTRLLIAFAIMAAVAALCGGIGLLLIDRIGGAVTVYADVTSPLQTESAALVDITRGMRAKALATISGADTEVAADQLQELDRESRARLSELVRLEKVAKVDIGASTLDSARAQYTSILRRVIEANNDARSAVAVSVAQRAQFDVLFRDTMGVLRAAIERAEGQINELEEKAKVDQESGVATLESLGDLISDLLTETYPRLQYTRRLAAEIDGFNDVGQLLALADWRSVDRLETDLQDRFKAAANILARLQGRMRAPQEINEFDLIRRKVAQMREALLGKDGVASSIRAALNARQAMNSGRATLEQIEAQYSSLLSNVRSAVDQLNRHARATALDTTATARIATLIGAGLAILFGLALAAMLARRITRSVVLLANHAAAITRTGELTPFSTPAGTRRFSEIEQLADAFNSMVTELAAAKSRLIEWSEGEIRTQYERLSVAINSMPQGLCMFDSEQKLIICNGRYGEIYGLPEELTTPGTPLRAILEHRASIGTYSHGSEDFIAERLKVVTSGEPWYDVNELRNGRLIAVTHHPIANGGSIATHEDVTERRKAELRIAYMAHHDALTDLPNRVRFREEMVEALNSVERGGMVAVLCLDLDYFKDVNDTLGHPVGDALLKQVAARLQEFVRPGDTIARLGGDEFAIIQRGDDQPVSATAIASRLIKELAAPFEVDGQQVVIGVSVGISVAPVDGKDADALLKKADMALYRAKEDGRGIYRFFEPEMDARMQSRRALELDLRKALALNQFEVHYQPIVNIQTGQIGCFEALLRWRHPERGLVAPDQFIPLAEEIGLINAIGAWVLKQACRDAMKWPKYIKVAVNLSSVQFKEHTLVLDVIAALAESGLQRGRLEAEITETVLLQDTDHTVETLNQLRDLGVHIAMDDFGTGYSSLGYLRKFAFDKIKIDRSFVSEIGHDDESSAIVRAVTNLGASLGMSTIAEGVETEEQLQSLRREGCIEAQGFLISKPRPADELAALIREIEEAKAVA